MPYIASTGIPSRVLATCPRCKTANRVFDAVGPLLQYQCGGCEWLFLFGAGTSPLNTNAAVTAGSSTALPFASGGTQFLLGQALYVSDTTLSELVVVSGTPTATSVPVSGFQNSHGSGKAITVAVPSVVNSSVEAVQPPGGWGFLDGGITEQVRGHRDHDGSRVGRHRSRLRHGDVRHRRGHHVRRPAADDLPGGNRAAAGLGHAR